MFYRNFLYLNLYNHCQKGLEIVATIRKPLSETDLSSIFDDPLVKKIISE